MAFNNGLKENAWAKQKALRAEYEKLGMSEEKFASVRTRSCEFNSNRKYSHTASMNPADLETDEDTNRIGRSLFESSERPCL